MNFTLHGKENFADVVKLKILRWRDDSGLLRWVEHKYEAPYKRNAGGSESEKEK